jgi:hypothetical protein
MRDETVDVEPDAVSELEAIAGALSVASTPDALDTAVNDILSVASRLRSGHPTRPCGACKGKGYVSYTDETRERTGLHPCEVCKGAGVRRAVLVDVHEIAEALREQALREREASRGAHQAAEFVLRRFAGCSGEET